MTEQLLPALSEAQRITLATLVVQGESIKLPQNFTRSLNALSRRGLVTGNLVDGYRITPAGRHAHEVLARAGK
jgi:hypothetical protein